MTPPDRAGLAISWETVGRGAGFALAIAVPAIVAAEVIDAVADLDPESNFIFLFYVLVVAGLVLGGWRAGKQAPDAPLSHGALAALVAYAVIAVGTSVLRLAGGDGVDAIGLVFNAFMAASAGILGGLVAGRRSASPGSEVRDPG
jgi:putative membrane protein (TIGR04086 family)